MPAPDCTHSIALIPSAPATGLAVRLFDCLLLWLERARQRAALGRLDDRMLADIGCNRATAQAEADKPFWRQ
jgi:uncharacterized protein YjiS (DUF1127 family)